MRTQITVTMETDNISVNGVTIHRQFFTIQGYANASNGSDSTYQPVGFTADSKEQAVKLIEALLTPPPAK